jgi:hypothetical protein
VTTRLTETKYRLRLYLIAVLVNACVSACADGASQDVNLSEQSDALLWPSLPGNQASILKRIELTPSHGKVGPCDTVTLRADVVLPHGKSVEYDWAIASAPPGARYTFISSPAATASLSSQDPGTYVISVSVTAFKGLQATKKTRVVVTERDGSCEGTTIHTANTGVVGTARGPGNLPPFTPSEDSDRFNEAAAPKVLTGGIRGPLSPVVTGSGTKTPGVDLAGAADPVVFVRNNPSAGNTSPVPDISGATGSNNIVITSHNAIVRFSSNAGTTFTTQNPTTIFPSAPTVDAMGNFLDNGFCCDQIILYAPSIDRFIWEMQFSGSAAATGGSPLQGTNRLRLAWARPQDLLTNFSTAWTYADFTSAQVANGATMDYPDLAIGNQDLYLSADAVGVGLLVIRIPLASIQNTMGAASIGFSYTTASDSNAAYGGHLTQAASGTMYWAGHSDNSTLRVFSWPEDSNQYSVRSVAVNTWPNCNYSSLTADGTTDWLSFQFNTFPGNAVLGSTFVPSGTSAGVWFGWVAGRGVVNTTTGACGPNVFPQPHVQLARIDPQTFQLLEQPQIWNGNYAFSYPALTTNADNEVGISLLWGGNGMFDVTHAVGIWGDFEVWNSGASQGSTNRNGDYVAVRPHAAAPSFYAGFGYNRVNNTPPATGLRVDPRYVLFGRESNVDNEGGPVGLE